MGDCRLSPKQWHHWQDVLIGSLIGQAGAIIGYRLRFPSPFVAGGRLVPHVMAEDQAKEHRSPPAEAVPGV